MSARVSVYEKQIAKEIEQMPKEYLSNLLKIVRLYRESVTLNPAEESFRQGWKEAMNDETYPIADLWAGIDARMTRSGCRLNTRRNSNATCEC